MFSPVTRNVGRKFDFEKSLEGSSLRAYKGSGNMCLLQPIPTDFWPPNKPEGYDFGGHGTPRSVFIC